MANRNLLTLGVAAAALAGMAWPAMAQTPPAAPGQPVEELPPVGVTATRGPKPITDVPATVTIIDRQQLDQQTAVRPGDITRYEAGVSFANQPARGGQANYVIRGIGGNRVLVLQDGLRVQDFPQTNLGAGTFNRDFVDLDTVKRVEILRGPASALYGSDALGGVVNYILKDPVDFLTGDKDVYISGRAGYSGVNSSVFGTITGAARQGPAELMLLYTRRDGHEQQANGTLDPNPQTFQSDSILARLLVHATDVDTVRVTGGFLRQATSTDIRTDIATTAGMFGAPSTAVLSSNGTDTNQRWYGVLSWTHDEPILFIDQVQVRFAYSQAQRTEETDQLRSSFTRPPPGINRRRLSDFGFYQNLFTADLQMNSRRQWGETTHYFTYGATVDWTTTRRPRDRIEVTLPAGTYTRAVAGETYPNKNFPDTSTVQAGLYVQDEVTWGRLDLTPALRIERYSLNPTYDADFLRSSGGALTINPLTQTSVSPKLGALFHMTDTYSAYAQYANGFRAPPYDSTNFGFTNRSFGYQILPATNLKSESSNGVEAGFRGVYPNAFWQLNGFYNAFSNFIDSKVVGTAGGLTQFQYVNLSDVNIWGFEGTGNWRFLPEWTVRGAFAWMHGEDNETGRPVDSVDPAKVVLGLQWQSPTGLGAEIVLTQGFRHSRVSDSAYFKAPAYTVLDLLARYEFNQNFAVNAGIFNVSNTKYFVSQDVVGVANNAPIRDLYAQPGRYVAMNAVLRW